MSAVTLTQQEKLFRRRVAMRLEETGEEPTPDNITEAMRHVIARDEYIVNRSLDLIAQARARREESPFADLSAAVYHGIRAKHAWRR